LIVERVEIGEKDSDNFNATVIKKKNFRYFILPMV
jgi:hypothetical protein